MSDSRSHAALWVAVGVVLLLLIGPMTLLAAIVSVAAGSAPDVLPGLCASDTNLERILATIRALESGGGDPAGDYRAEAAGATASGAYQYVDGTWAGYGGYTHAADALPDIQDAKAAEDVRAVLATYQGDVSKVPIRWYLPSALDDPSLLDDVPMPDAGNRLTIREYQRRWMDTYHRLTGYGTATSGICYAAVGLGFNGALPDLLEHCATAWGGYRNGHIPYQAMRYSPVSGYLHTAASQSFDQLYAAAQAAGFDLRGSGYRPFDQGAETAGRSCHGSAMAVDVDVLVTGHRYATADEGFASAEFAWLCANAERYGWVVPRYVMPTGMRCGGVVGNGVGGCVGERCGIMEPWHVEAVGVAMVHADFAAAPRTP